MTMWRGLVILVLIGGLIGGSVAVAVARPLRPDPAIVHVQVSLHALGYDPGLIDGFWGRRTTTALAAYAQDRRIVLNEATLNLVLALLRLETFEEFSSAEGEGAVEEGGAPRQLPIQQW